MTYTERLIKLTQSNSFFLFGARNTGKSTLLRHTFQKESTYWIDLLDPDQEDRYTRDPKSLKYEVLALEDTTTHIVIDEIQKIPKLLDIVHQLIEATDKIFVLTGSSARKLKYGGANLLAGRAFIYNLYPFSVFEFESHFSLENTLRWGSLPAIIYKMQTEEDKSKFLQAYAQTYLREEIWSEQLIRKLDPFRKFLEVSAQCNGQIINYAKIAADVDVDDKTVKQYFSILEDTLMGFMLEPYYLSIRKRLHSKPKFYYFDTGVCRALSRLLSVPLIQSTSEYGMVFEHFIIIEAIKLANYYYPEFRFSYLKTKDGIEVDLVVERPGQKTLCIEIKSAEFVTEDKISSFMTLTNDIQNCEAVCISREQITKKIGNVTIIPWKEALRKYFT